MKEVANLLVMVLGYFAYRVIMGGKQNSEMDDIEKALNTNVGELNKKNPTKKDSANTVIDVAEDDKMPEMPMPDLSVAPDDPMADNLFPLDTLEDPKDKH